jgi:hypothetical protein
MKRIALITMFALAGCDEAMMASTGAGFSGGGSARPEFLVVGNRMSFEQCRARGGLIIRDRGNPMVMCDPSVRGEPVPPDEFDHPESRAAAAAAQG